MIEVVAGGKDCFEAVDGGCDPAVKGTGQTVVGRRRRRKEEVSCIHISTSGSWCVRDGDGMDQK